MRAFIAADLPETVLSLDARSYDILSTMHYILTMRPARY